MNYHRISIPFVLCPLVGAFVLGCGSDAKSGDSIPARPSVELNLVSLFTSTEELTEADHIGILSGNQGRGEAPMRGQGTPCVNEQNQEIYLPLGTGLSYYLRLGEAKNQLEFAGVRAIDAVGQLRVTIAADGSGPIRHEVPVSNDAVSWKIPDSMAGIVQLTLSAVPSRSTGSTSGVLVLEEPLLLLWNSMGGEGRDLRPPPIKPHANILLYVVDTVRADHIGFYGYDRPISPRVDAFAQRSIAFLDAVAQTPWTRASVASILTGLYPDNHHANSGNEKLAEEFVTLAEIFSKQGYQSAAFVTNGNLAPEFGLDQGFDTYVHLKERGVKVHRPAEELHAEAIGWLGERSKEQPFFLYVHATDPHAPYTPPAGFQKEFAPNLRYPEASSLQVITELFKGERQADDDLREDLVRLYDAEIAYWDHEFGNLLDSLENAGLANDTIVVLVSDHGEEFAEHGGWQHSTSVHSEQIQVPFVIHLPLEWGAGTRVPTPVQHVDIFPTLLDLLGLEDEEVEAQLDGRSLLPHMIGADIADINVRSSLRTRSRIITDCVVGGEFKLVRRWSNNEPTIRLLYDRALDPGDFHDISNEYPIAVEFFDRQLPSAAIDPGSLPRAEMESETRDALKALGYIE